MGKNFYRIGNSGFFRQRRRIKKRAPDKYKISAHRQRLYDIRTPADSTIEKDRQIAFFGHDIRQNLEGGNGGIELAPAMIGNEYTIKADLPGDRRVFGGKYALNQEFPLPSLS